MAQVLFAGGKLNSVTTTGTVVDSSVAGRFNATYCDSALNCDSTADIWTAAFVDSSGAAATVTTGQTCYAHVDIHRVSGGATTGPYLFLNGGGFPWLSVRGTGVSETVALYGNTGTGASPTWTQIGTGAGVLTAGVTYTIDIKVTLGSPHAVEFSIGGTLISSGTFTQASLTSLDTFSGTMPTSISQHCYSQILVTEGISTINAKVRYTSATAAGTNSGWTGAYTDINEAVGSDATVLSATSAGLKSTFAMDDVTVPAGYVIKDVFIWSRGKNDGSAPANIKTVIRSGGTDYAGSNMAGIGTSFGPLLDRRATDPATSTAWTQSGWNAAEVGVESAT